MNRKALSSALATAAVLLVLGCKDSLDIGNFSVTGLWAGTTKQQVSGADSATYTFTMDLRQKERDVSGTAVVKVGTDSVVADVNGIWNYPSVTLQLTAPEFAALQFNAAFTPQANRDTLAGPLLGSGFNNVTLKLVRRTE